jgi:hypothetical protein
MYAKYCSKQKLLDGQYKTLNDRRQIKILIKLENYLCLGYLEDKASN